jgi:DNA polymerase-3 subunit alpha
MRDGRKASLGGVITGRRARRDKRDREYAIITVEDFDGSIEVMVFSDALEVCRPLLKTDSLVAIQGTVKVRAADSLGRGQGVPQFWAERVMLFKDCSRFLKAVVVQVPEKEMDDVLLLKLKERLEEHLGAGLAYLRLAEPDGTYREMLLKQYRVSISNELVASLREVFGPDSVRFKGEMPPCASNADRFRRGGQNKGQKPGS